MKHKRGESWQQNTRGMESDARERSRRIGGDSLNSPLNKAVQNHGVEAFTIGRLRDVTIELLIGQND
jgi:hypothetical protein